MTRNKTAIIEKGNNPKEPKQKAVLVPGRLLYSWALSANDVTGDLRH